MMTPAAEAEVCLKDSLKRTRESPLTLFEEGRWCVFSPNGLKMRGDNTDTVHLDALV